MKWIVTLAFVLLQTTGLSAFILSPDYNHIYRQKHIIIYRNNTQINLITDNGNQAGKSILLPVKPETQIEFFSYADIFADLENISSTYMPVQYTPHSGKIIPRSNHAYQIIHEDEIKRIIQKNPSINKEEALRAVEFYKKSGFSFIRIPCSTEKRVIKLTTKGTALFIPLEIYRMNNNLAVIENDYYVLAENRVSHPLLTTEFTVQFYAGKASPTGITGYPLNLLSKIVPEIKNSVIHFTRLKSRWIKKFFNQNILLRSEGSAPAQFTREFFISLKREENFQPTRKLYLTQLLFMGDLINAAEIRYFYNIWKTGEYRQNFRFTGWKNLGVFQSGLPELFMIDIISRVQTVQRWAILTFGGVRLLRFTLPDKPGYRMLYTPSVSPKGLSSILGGYKNLSGNFNGEYLVFSKEKRIIVVRKTSAGLFAMDYNGYRLKNWNSALSDHEKEKMIRTMKNVLNGIKINEEEQQYIERYFMR